MDLTTELLKTLDYTVDLIRNFSPTRKQGRKAYEDSKLKKLKPNDHYSKAAKFRMNPSHCDLYVVCPYCEDGVGDLVRPLYYGNAKDIYKYFCCEYCLTFTCYLSPESSYDIQRNIMYGIHNRDIRTSWLMQIRDNHLPKQSRFQLNRVKLMRT